MSRILFVDDSSHHRDVFGQALEGWGYDVVRTCDGDEALEKTKSESFDLILSDVKMLRISGIELCAMLKEGDSTRDIPVILFSGVPNDEIKAHDAGAQDYLNLPVKFSELRARISEALE